MPSHIGGKSLISRLEPTALELEAKLMEVIGWLSGYLHENLRGPHHPPKCHVETPQETDVEKNKQVVKNDLIRPAISWGAWYGGGVPLDSHDIYLM